MRLAPLLLALACGSRDPSPVVDTAAPATAVTGPSLYDLPVRLDDASGRAVGLDVGRGHPTVVAMFYGSCTLACPMLFQRIESFRDALPPATAADLRIVMISFDDVRDTPAALAEQTLARGLDDHWTLLAGDPDAVRDVAAVLGVQYRKRPDGEFDHSTGFTVLDREGRVLARVDGLSASFDAAVTATR